MWQGYTAPVTIGDGEHRLRVRAVDEAGNGTERVLEFQVDGTRPGITLPERWPIWERVEVAVRDGQSGLAKVEVTVRDREERWPAVSWVYAVDGQTFAAEIVWDRRFADGTVAPIGEYEVVVEARDVAGNVAWERAHLVIPAPGVTVTPWPTRTSQPTATVTMTATPVWSSSSSPAQVAPTAASSVVSFRSTNPPIPQSSNSPISQSSNSPVSQSSNVLWGAAALAAIGAATAWALEQQRQRREEEARARAEAQAANARAEAREAEERRRQAEAAWRKKQEEAQKRQEEEAREAEYYRRRAAEQEQMLAWSERQREVLKAYKPPMDYEALRRTLPPYSAAQEEKKPWWKKVGILRDSVDSLQDGIDFVAGIASTARASWRLAFPSRFGSLTWEKMVWNEFESQVRRGVITDKNFLDELARLPNENFRKWPINYTDLADAWDGIRQMGGSGLNLTPLALQIGGVAVERHNPQLGRDLQSAGGTLDGMLTLWQGWKQIQQGAKWLDKMLRSPFGKPLIVIQVAIGAFDYVAGGYRLIYDPTILPGASQHAWTERVGVATQAIGGAFLVAGAVSAFVPGLQPAAPIFLTAGVLFEGAGMIMQNWGWITEKAAQFFGRP